MAFLSLHHWAGAQKKTIHVVAKDVDWKNACNTATWCSLSDLGTLAAALRAPIDLTDEQLATLAAELESEMAEALEGISPEVTNRPESRRYDIEAISNVADMQLSLTKAKAADVGFSATFHFEADVTLTITDRYFRTVSCDTRIRGELYVSLDPGYKVQDVSVARWSFEMPDIRIPEVKEAEGTWWREE
jgi:hypothetical protein